MVRIKFDWNPKSSLLLISLVSCDREALADKLKATRALQSLKNDLKRLLETRGNIEGLQKLLMEKDFVLGNAVLEKLRRSSSCS